MSTSFSASVTITRPANTTAYSDGDAIGIDPGTLQVETATASGTITEAVAQVETATIVGTITTTGNMEVIVTGAALENSPITFSVAVTELDDDATVATAVRAALSANENIADAYTVGGTGADVVLTAINAVANDATLNIAYDNDTCAGLTPDATSANTTAGVAAGDGNAAVVVTSALIAASPITLSVAVAAGDTAADWAEKVRDALDADTRITEFYTVSGSTTSIVLTAKTAAANDATLNISLDNDTCTGISTAASSTNTTAGSASSSTAGSAILTFFPVTNPGESVYITDVNLDWHVSSLPSGASTFRLHLYNEAPGAILDNAAWDLSSAGDRGKYLGYVTIAQPVDLGSTLTSQNVVVNKLVRLAPQTNAIYGVLQTVTGFTPASGSVFKVTMGGVAA